MTKVLISGYYGFDNAGDDAVLYGIISSLKKIDPTIEISVLSNHVEETKKLFQIPAHDRWNIKEILKQISKVDLVILGGGTLLQDRTSPRSPLYYLGITLLAKMLGKPVFYYGQGFGPIVHHTSKRMIRYIANRVDTITVRDQQSGDEMKQYGILKAPIYVAADPALTINPLEANFDEAGELLRSYNVDLNKPIAFVSVRNWKNENEFKKELAIACDHLIQQGWQVVFIAMQNPNDITPSLDILLQMEEQAVVIDKALNFKQLMSLIGMGNLVIGMRLHAVILSALMNVPFIALSYDPKIERFAESFGKSSIASIDNLTAAQLTTELDALIKRLPLEKEKLQKQLKPIVKQALKSAELVYKVLEDKDKDKEKDKDKKKK